jgi:hypothetical protein
MTDVRGPATTRLRGRAATTRQPSAPVLNGLLAGERSSRIVSLVLAALLAATVIGVWI